ncbi:MAG: PASTA domain-containing protein [Erysipelotrichaceae bacterium]|nr:PASTA domain-containing protein [Erysipelotrichaceae bacterium]
MPEDNKDFLDQFSNAGKPASFAEEERTPVVRERKPVNPKVIAFAAIALVLLGIGVYFLFFAPKIEMPDFVGKTKSDIGAWVKQQGIEASGVIFEETYDFDSEDGTVLTQSVKAGKKVKKNVKLNFTLSLGPDPEERIKVPELETMNKEEIQEWIKENKLLKTKTITAYNEYVVENNVIDYSFSGCDEDSFTRGCTLKINVSKGPAPAGKVTMEDFEKKPFATVEAWCKSKKIELIKVEQYSDKVDDGYVISQSVASGKVIKEGESLTVVVSLGQAVYMPDMIGWNEKQLRAWQTKNPAVSLYTNEYYSSEPKGIILKQSLPVGTLIDTDKYVELTVSLGNYVDLGTSFVGTEYHAQGGLHDWKDKQNEMGADIKVNRTYEFSDRYPAEVIIRHDNAVEVGGTLNVVVSKGKNILLEDGKEVVLTWADLAAGNATEETARALCEENDVNYEIVYSYKVGKNNGDVISAIRKDGEVLVAKTYLPQDVKVVITVSDDSYKN